MARTNNLTNFLTDVAAAIKNKKGSQTDIPASQFDTEITNLPSGGTYQHKTVSVTQNGTSTVVPDSGYDAIDELTISTAVPEKQLQTKTYSFTQNTNIELLPDTGYDGFNQVNLEIDVTDSEYATNLALSEQILGPVILPYTELEWLRTNNGYVRFENSTDYNATAIEFKYEILSNGGYNLVFQGQRYGLQSSSQNQILFRYNSRSDTNTNVQHYANVPITVKMSPGSVAVDGVVTNTFSISSDTNNDYFYLPGYPDDRVYTSDIKIYEFNIYTNNTLTKHLIPVIKKEDNLVYLYDTIGEQYYRHSNFTAGPIKV